MHDARMYSVDDIELCRAAVLGTQVLLSRDIPGLIVGQVANTQLYPSARAELIAKLVACGDFASLYAPKGPILAHELYRERQGAGCGEVPSLKNFHAFQFGYVQLLLTYAYPLPLAEEHFTLKKQEVITNALDLLLKVRTGAVKTWEEIIEHDTKFLQHYEIDLLQ